MDRIIKIWEQDGIYEQSLLSEFRQAIDNQHIDSCHIHFPSSYKSDFLIHFQQQPQESSAPSQQPAAEDGEKWGSNGEKERKCFKRTESAAYVFWSKTTRFYDFGEEIVAAGEAVSFVLEPQPPSSSAKVKLTNKSSANAELRVNTNQRISETGAKEVTGKEHLFTLPASCGIFFDEPVADHAEREVVVTNTGAEDMRIVVAISITALTDVRAHEKVVPAPTHYKYSVQANVKRNKVVDGKDSIREQYKIMDALCSFFLHACFLSFSYYGVYLTFLFVVRLVFSD